MSKKIERQIFLEGLPKKYGIGKYKNKLMIDWENSIGYKVNFIYDDIEGDLEILQYSPNEQILQIKYNDDILKISIGNLKRCKLGKLLNKITVEFKLEIEQVFKDDKRNLTIINREHRDKLKNNNYIQHEKWYEYHCNKCGAELWMIESGLLSQNHNCACCSNQIIVKGINDIATTNKELIPYFVNTEDIYTYTYASSKKTLTTCPDCGYEKKMVISSLSKQGFSCPRCSDGISYPEKLMFSVLEQLKENKQIDNFIYQYTKTNNKWCGKYKYDFYFEKEGQEYIIETHGEQHYKEEHGKWAKLDEVQENDKNKKELAIYNGIKEKNYIITDCRKSDFEFIKNNILSSKLEQMFNLNKIDWIKCGEYTCKNLVKEICDYWHLHNEINNEELTTSDLAKEFKISNTTILRYLKRGTKLDWCNYDGKKELIKSNKQKGILSGIKISKPVEMFKNNISIGIFESCTELERQSQKLFGVKLLQSNTSMVCNNKRPQHKGYTFKYIPKEEYEERIKHQKEKVS